MVVPALANKGIGWDVARILAESGVKTVVAARNEELGRQAVAKLQEATGACPGAAPPEADCLWSAALVGREAAADVSYCLSAGAHAWAHAVSKAQGCKRSRGRAPSRMSVTSTAAGLHRPAGQRLPWLAIMAATPAPAARQPRRPLCFSRRPHTLTRRPCPGSQAVLFRQLDIASPGSVDAFAKWAAEELRHVDILVNNAGARRASDVPRRARSSLQTAAQARLAGARRADVMAMPCLSPGDLR